VAAYGEVGAVRPDWWDDEVAKLGVAATDGRWRVREAVAGPAGPRPRAAGRPSAPPRWVSGGFLEWTSPAGPMKGRRMAKASARPRPEWEQLPDSGQRIYLALAEGDVDRARQLYQHDQHDQRPRGRRRRGGGGAKATKTTVAARRPGRDLRGFVDRDGRLVPPEMAAAEAWKRRQARRGAEDV
jgi:hypothetical protein